MKKGFLFLFLLAFVFLFSFSAKVNATTSDNSKGVWNPTKEEVIDVYGMKHLEAYGTSNNDGKQHVNVLSMKTDGVSSKLVTWAVSNEHHYSRVTLDALAKDYEKNHPGWIVVGGINADQYTTTFGNNLGAGSAYFTPQTYYPLIMDGESRIPYTALNTWNMHVGFANDGSENSLVPASDIKGYVLSILDENNKLVKKFDVNKINESPNNSEVSAWSTYISTSTNNKYIETKVTSSNEDIYVIETPELAYMSNCVQYGGKNSLFARGSISKVTKDVTLVNNQFAVEVKNDEIKEYLKVGTKVVVDAEYVSDALNNCEASTGFHSAHRINGVDQPLVHTQYDGNRYSRAIIGRKADGTYMLVVVDLATDPRDLKTRYLGMGFDECNALLKHYGIVEAYQMDGGGSVTSIYRDENNKFVVSNYPRDGIRANMTGLLFVVRDPRLEVTTTTHCSVTLEKVGDTFNEISNVVVKHNGTNYPLVDGSVTIPGLDEATEYRLPVSFDVENDGVKISCNTYINIKTKIFDGVKAVFKAENIQKNSFTFVKEENKNVQNVKIRVNETDYALTSDKIEIKDLIESTEYTIEIDYDLVDEATNVHYPRTHTMSVTTSLFDKPTIVEFLVQSQRTNRIVFKYEYKDDDGVVDVACVKYNDVITSVNAKSGLVTISNIDLENEQYEFTFVLMYKASTSALQTIESEKIIVGEKPVQKKEYNITYECLGTHTNPLIYTEGEEVVLTDALLDGYSFDGWFLNGEKIEKIDVTKTGDLTLVARFTKILKTFNITYNTDAEHENPGKFTEGDVITLKDAKKEGYTFKGWMLSGKQVTELKDLTSDVTLTAEFEKLAAPTTKKGCGCKKNAAVLVFALTSVIALTCIILKKKH